jgi:hypothetical protein
MQNFNGTPIGGIGSNINVIFGLLRHLVIASIFRKIQDILLRIEGDGQINPTKHVCDCIGGVTTRDIIFESVALQAIKMSIFLRPNCDIQ